MWSKPSVGTTSGTVREPLTVAMVGIADRIVADGLQRWSGSVLGRVATHATDLVAAIDWCIAPHHRAESAYRLYTPLFAAVHQSRSSMVCCGERLFGRWPDTVAPLRGEALGVLATGAAIAGDFARAGGTGRGRRWPPRRFPASLEHWRTERSRSSPCASGTGRQRRASSSGRSPRPARSRCRRSCAS